MVYGHPSDKYYSKEPSLPEYPSMNPDDPNTRYDSSNEVDILASDIDIYEEKVNTYHPQLTFDKNTTELNARLNGINSSISYDYDDYWLFNNFKLYWKKHIGKSYYKSNNFMNLLEMNFI